MKMKINHKVLGELEVTYKKGWLYITVESQLTKCEIDYNSGKCVLLFKDEVKYQGNKIPGLKIDTDTYHPFL